ncbi:MAG: chromate efflux transporter [Hyphomicrobiaceae bacterium]
MTDINASSAADAETANPSFAEAFSVWTRIGLLSFCGPAGQIALMHRILVDEKKWLPENRFLHALNFCMLLPGPEAMQLATYAGWMMHGLRGGLAAGIMFVLPGACVVLALALIYATFGNVPLVEALFLGVKAAVLIVVVEALLRISRKALKRPVDWWIAAAAFIAIFFFAAPYPLIVLVAALVGWWLVTASETDTAPAVAGTPVRTTETIRTIAVWLAIWLVPLALIGWTLGPDHVIAQTGIFFSKLAVVTFGGAYAVLAYMAQEVVEGYKWLTAGEMLDGLGLAETTPGPLILVTEFVGTLAGWRANGGMSFGMALAGAAVTLWATFVPCFLWIFAGAPYIERLGENARLKSALAGVTAAVVGVILNLSLWFALHVLFATVTRTHAGPLQLWIPDFTTLDFRAFTLALIATATLLFLHWGILPTLALCAGLSSAWYAMS